MTIDHLPNVRIFDKLSSLSNNVKLYRRDYSRFNPQDLSYEFQSVNRQTVLLSDQDPSTILSSLYYKISTIFDKHIPFKQL